MASEWNLWVWLECIGVVIGCCCKEVALFWQHHPYRNESTEVQTLGAIRIQLYHQCFEQVWQHNFTSIISLRRSTQRHRSSKVGASIVDLRKSTHRSSKVDTSIFED